MTVLFVLATFAFFLALDAWMRRHEPASQSVPAAAEMPFVPEPVWVAGYQLPGEMHYHRGHTWARPLNADTAVVGLDDFARRLTGGATRVELPAAGTWLRQGGKAASLGLDGRNVDVVSPIEGEVLEVNPQLAGHPELATSDPYSHGWLFKIRTSEMGRNLANLMSGSLAHRFAEDTRERLQHQLMALSGTVLADGGEPSPDFARHLQPEDWRHLVHEFLLT